MFVACSTQCFARLPLERCLRIIGELEFSKLDVAIHESGPHLKPSDVVADVALAAQRIRIGPRLTPAAFDLEIEAESAEDYQNQLKAICKLARLSTVSTLTIAASPSGTPIADEVRRLTPLVKLTSSESIILTVATRNGTLTELPTTAVELCERVPGLGLTFDPSHYIVGPGQDAPIEAIFPHIRHVHLRDTGRGPGQFQVRVGQGEVEYGRILSLLQRAGYDRLLTVALYDVAEAPFAMESEVRKLKYLLESLV